MSRKPQSVMFFEDEREALLITLQFRGTPYAVKSPTVGYNIYVHDFTPIPVGVAEKKEDCQIVYEVWLQRQP